MDPDNRKDLTENDFGYYEDLEPLKNPVIDRWKHKTGRRKSFGGPWPVGAKKC